MNNIHLLIIAILLAALFATYSHAQPESDIATPAEVSTYEHSIPNIGSEENKNWQMLREERKAAREQILANIKSNLKAEKKDLQQEKIQPSKAASFKALEAKEKHPPENKHKDEINPPGPNHDIIPPGHHKNLP